MAHHHQPGSSAGTSAWFNDDVVSLRVNQRSLTDVLDHVDGTASSQQRIGGLITQFYARLTAQGVTRLQDVTRDHCDGFIWATTENGDQPSIHTAHLRRTALRNLFRIATANDPTLTDPTRHVTLPAKPGPTGRPVTDDEHALIRTAALGKNTDALRTAAIIALLEAGATTGEIAGVRWDDLNLDTHSVALPGATPVKPRVVGITYWGHGVLERHATSSSGEFVVTVGGTTGDSHVSQASIVNTVRRVIRTAGITDPGVKPGSIRLWAARRHFNDSGLEAAARTLGFDSLDRAADAIGYRWQDGDR